MRFLRLSCGLMAAVLLGLMGTEVAAAGAAGPEFMDRDPLSITLDRLASGRPLQVAIVNPGPAVDAQVRIAGAVADALTVSGAGTIHLAAGGATMITVTAGPHRHAGGGQLVLIAETGLARRQIIVTESWWFIRYWVPLAIALLLVSGGLLWWWRRRRHTETDGAGIGDEPKQAVFTHSDEPAKTDRLNRSEYARELALLASSATPPMVIGVFGEWGTGKTSLLMQVREVLEQDYPDCAHVWFDPWPHQYEGNPVLPLLHVIVAELKLARREEIRRTLRTISEVLGSLVLTSSVGLNLDDVRKSIKAYDETNFRIRSERTRLDEHLSSLIRQALVATGKRRLVVFIDDLDRCAADQITALLEALKLHFNRDNCVFFLGVAKEPLIAAVRGKYGEQPAVNYLDKIVQFPFEMPRLSQDEFRAYLESLLRDEIRPARELLAIGLPHNPRTVKRFVNVLILQDRVARARRLASYDVAILAAVLLIRDGDGEFYKRLGKDSTLLKRIAEDIETAEEGQVPDWDPLALAIVGFLRTERGVPDDVRPYIDLVKASPAPQQPEGPEPESTSETFSDLGRHGQGELRSVLHVLAGRVDRQVSQLVGDESTLLAPVVRVDEMPPRPIAMEELLELWNEGLILLGSPGTGKTVLAARLTRRLIQQAGPDDPIPVFLRFRALKFADANFELWVTHALTDEYRIPITNAFALVSRGHLVYVLDGLDEVDPPDRSKIVQELLNWQALTGAKILVTDRVRPARDPLADHPAFRRAEVLGVLEEDSTELLRKVLAARGVRLERLRMPAGTLRSPEFLAVLTSMTAWIEDLPARQVDFIPWYADWAQQKAAAGVGPPIKQILHDLARHLVYERKETFSSEDPEVRNIFRRGEVRGLEVPNAIRAMSEAGLIREVAPDVHHFVHPLLLEYLAGPHNGS
ncbi:hypothetical protein Psi02_50910 [Planotetraspora silvatica]|uniref:NACHT domain-containing protein n=1 Tax=Planotetraspora silvatica TaxID=234614 RepID=A0A8J3XNK7_9ACTN|nr:P-loop NTPase fold protein [Planotetraspora silvatica]GII48667.1 hypothetical protein Psi02_50910 [Planotetraspora silvatica]